MGLRLGAVSLAALMAVGSLSAAAHHERQADCRAPAELVRLSEPLPHTARAVRLDRRLRVVAIGSSSTSGVGASDASHAYPARLAVELEPRFSGVEIEVLNKGVGGETADQMLERFDRDVVALKPNLVLWQVGSNSALRGGSLDALEAAVRGGIERIRAARADVVLIDLQYAPRILSRPLHADVLDSLRKVALELRVAIFGRFAVMKHWVTTGRIGFADALRPDQLHLSDVSYACLARALADGIESATRAAEPAVSSTVSRPLTP
jgi:lysophospholipase L1-like esterase